MARGEDVSEIARWLADAADALAVTLKSLPSAEAQRISSAAKQRYVRGNPRAWWLDLAVACEQFDSTKETLGSVLPAKAGKVWLLPETEGDPLAYEIDAADLQRVIAECPYFEYYVLAQDLSWLVAESDHNVFFVCRDSGS